MNRLFVFLLACVIAQFSYGQNELSIKEMEDSVTSNLEKKIKTCPLDPPNVPPRFCHVEIAKKDNGYTIS